MRAIPTEKNICPKAARITPNVILEKSGVKYHINPSNDPSNVLEPNASSINITRRTGIKTLDTSSTPPWRPLAATKAIIPDITALYMIRVPGSRCKSLKWVCMVSDV